jgi:hypothetical protein
MIYMEFDINVENVGIIRILCNRCTVRQSSDKKMAGAAQQQSPPVIREGPQPEFVPVC